MTTLSRLSCALFLFATLLGLAGCKASREATQRPSWYEKERLLDVTGDGIPDRLALTARGARTDSLDIRLTIWVKGKKTFEEGWGSGYELVDPPLTNPTPAQVDSFLRARLDTVLASIALVPYGNASIDGARECQNEGSDGSLESCIAWELNLETVDWNKLPQDSVSPVMSLLKMRPYDTLEVRAMADEIRRRRLPRVGLGFGYESYLELAWSDRAGRFFEMSYCC